MTIYFIVTVYLMYSSHYIKIENKNKISTIGKLPVGVVKVGG